MPELKRILRFQPLINSLYNTARDQLGFEPHVKIVIIKNGENMQNPLGKTAQYSPSEQKIGLYTQGRHIKDILRSLAHELVHHNQNCRGDFDNGAATVAGYAQEDGHLREMEREAYEVGNLIFRDWEDNLKDKGARPLFTSTHYANAIMEKGENLMEKQLVESHLRNIIRGVIQEMFDDDLNEGDMVTGSEADTEASELGRSAETRAQATVAAAEDQGGGGVDDALGAVDEEKENLEEGEGLGKWIDWCAKRMKKPRGSLGVQNCAKKKLEAEKAKNLEEGSGEKENLEEEESTQEEVKESFFPKDRSIREKARFELNEALTKRWAKIIK